MTEFSEQSSLHGKMASVMLAIGGISKSGKNSHQNYAFIKHSDVFAKVQELLGSHGIAMYSNVIGYELLPTDKGTHVVLQMKFILACQDTGQAMECLWVGEAKDSSDKAFNKAMTAGMKYFLLTTFLIASDEAKDADSESPSTGRPTTQKKNSNNSSLEIDDYITEQDKPASMQHSVNEAIAPNGLVYTDELEVIEAKVNASKKRYYITGGCTFFSRDVFRDLEFSATTLENLEKQAKTTVLMSEKFRIAYTTNDKGYKTPVKVHRVSTNKTVEIKDKK